MKILKLASLVTALLCTAAQAGEELKSTPAIKVNSFVQSAGVSEQYQNGGMFDLYEENRAQAIPNLITPDFLLLAYSQLRQARIAETENQMMRPAFEQLLKRLSLDLQDGEVAASGVPESGAFVAFLQALLGGDSTDLPEHYQAEFELVMQGAGIEHSPVWNCSMDYSQFVPRGRYTESPETKAYFKAIKYASSALFAFQPTAATGVDNRQAGQNAQVALALANSLSKPGIVELYDQLNEQIEWNFGRSEDMRREDLLQAAEAAADTQGQATSLLQVAERNDRVPDILSGVVDVSRLEPGLTASRALTGWRFLPASYSASAAAFQKLVFESGDDLVLDCDACDTSPINSSVVQGKVVKGYPSHLELMSMLGSTAATSEIDARQLNRYSQYQSVRDAALFDLASAAGLEQRENQILQAIFRSTMPADQALAGAAGFWAWQKYLNVLYQKQSYTVIGKGLGIQKQKSREGAWIVPATGVYMALANLIDVQIARDSNERWSSLKDVVNQSITISSRIELGLPPTAEQEAFLNEVDASLKRIGGGEDAPIVVDLHTNAADSTVLELGIGKPAVRQHERARGAGFNVSEFTVPIDQRLDDNSWRALLADDSAG